MVKVWGNSTPDQFFLFFVPEKKDHFYRTGYEKQEFFPNKNLFNPSVYTSSLAR